MSWISETEQLEILNPDPKFRTDGMNRKSLVAFVRKCNRIRHPFTPISDYAYRDKEYRREDLKRQYRAWKKFMSSTRIAGGYSL